MGKRTVEISVVPLTYVAQNISGSWCFFCSRTSTYIERTCEMQAIDIFGEDCCPRGYRHTGAAQQVALQQYTYNCQLLGRTTMVLIVLINTAVWILFTWGEFHVLKRNLCIRYEGTLSGRNRRFISPIASCTNHHDLSLDGWII